MTPRLTTILDFGMIPGERRPDALIFGGKPGGGKARPVKEAPFLPVTVQKSQFGDIMMTAAGGLRRKVEEMGIWKL